MNAIVLQAFGRRWICERILMEHQERKEVIKLTHTLLKKKMMEDKKRLKRIMDGKVSGEEDGVAGRVEVMLRRARYAQLLYTTSNISPYLMACAQLNLPSSSLSNFFIRKFRCCRVCCRYRGRVVREVVSRKFTGKIHRQRQEIAATVRALPHARARQRAAEFNPSSIS